jgi:hypothetical protein
MAGRGAGRPRAPAAARNARMIDGDFCSIARARRSSRHDARTLVPKLVGGTRPLGLHRERHRVGRWARRPAVNPPVWGFGGLPAPSRDPPRLAAFVGLCVAILTAAPQLVEPDDYAYRGLDSRATRASSASPVARPAREAVSARAGATRTGSWDGSRFRAATAFQIDGNSLRVARNAPRSRSISLSQETPPSTVISCPLRTGRAARSRSPRALAPPSGGAASLVDAVLLLSMQLSSGRHGLHASVEPPIEAIRRRRPGDRFGSRAGLASGDRSGDEPQPRRQLLLAATAWARLRPRCCSVKNAGAKLAPTVLPETTIRGSLATVVAVRYRQLWKSSIRQPVAPRSIPALSARLRSHHDALRAPYV